MVKDRVRVVVLEELEGVVGGGREREREGVYTLEGEMESMGANVLVLATSGEVDKVEKRLRRKGRFDIEVRMEMPSDEDRFFIF